MAKKPVKKAASSQAQELRILVASGVNLDLLGRREPAIYGTASLEEIHRLLAEKAGALADLAGVGEVELVFFQTNDETRFLEALTDDFDGALLNPGAWTHTSLALADRLKGLRLPFVEVHLSNLAGRDELRQRSLAAPHAAGVVYGLGVDSYLAGLLGLIRHLAALRA